MRVFLCDIVRNWQGEFLKRYVSLLRAFSAEKRISVSHPLAAISLHRLQLRLHWAHLSILGRADKNKGSTGCFHTFLSVDKGACTGACHSADSTE